MKIFARSHPILLLVSFLSLAVFASAQYSINWWTIDGGGGTSSGGPYTLQGTIGQPDAGTLSGGPNVLERGFMSGIYVVQTLGSPVLTITKTDTNAVISWPLDAGLGFTLEEAPTIISSNWTPSAVLFSTNGNVKSTTVSPTGTARFFRLRAP